MYSSLLLRVFWLTRHSKGSSLLIFDPDNSFILVMSVEGF